MVVVRRPWASCGEIQTAWGDFGWPVKAIGVLWGVQATCWSEVCMGEPWATWVSYVGFVSAWKGGTGCIWWCSGRVWSVKEVQAACGGHGGHEVHVDDLWAMCVLWGRCGLHVVAMGWVWSTYELCMSYVYGLCVCNEGGVGCMWWPLWPWGACSIPMGYVCTVTEVQAACDGHGGHGVRVDYLSVVYELHILACGCGFHDYWSIQIHG